MKPQPFRLAFCSLVLAALPALPAGQAAPAPSSVPQGPITVHWRKGFDYAGSKLRLVGDVVVTGTTYDLNAQTVTLTFPPSGPGNSGTSSVTEAVAVGDPATGTQVTGRFVQAAQNQTVHLQADKAIYHPDASRPEGGRIDFTGHVRLTFESPTHLAEPAPMDVEQPGLTVLLGMGPDYPQIDGSGGTLTLTPNPAPPK